MAEQLPDSGQEAPETAAAASTGSPAGGAVSSSPPKAASSGSGDVSWALIIFWGAIIVGGLLYDNFGRNADVMLNVSCGSPLSASGTVTYEGAPVVGRT